MKYGSIEIDITKSLQLVLRDFVSSFTATLLLLLLRAVCAIIVVTAFMPKHDLAPEFLFK